MNKYFSITHGKFKYEFTIEAQAKPLRYELCNSIALVPLLDNAWYFAWFLNLVFFKGSIYIYYEGTPSDE